MREREKHTPNLLTLSVIGGLGILLSQAAFSRKSKNEIIGRAGNRSEISGLSPEEAGGPLHCMHLDHPRDETYDEPSRGLLVTKREHLIYHRNHRGRAHEIGLSEEHNEQSINLIMSLLKRR